MLAIRLPQSIEKSLEKLAQRTGRTETYYIREATSNTWRRWKTRIWPKGQNSFMVGPFTRPLFSKVWS